MRKYARGTRMSSKVQREAYQNLINETFKKQISFITTDPQEEELIDEEIEDEITNNFNKPSSYNEESQINEEKQYVNNTSFSQKKSKKKSKLTNNNETARKNDDKIIKLYRKNCSIINNSINSNQNNFSEGETSFIGVI
jgi:hypothetical protein